jgi:nucleoside-diphosphate-sugar epimerase
MNVLVTGAASRLGQMAASELGRTHRIRMMDEDTSGLKAPTGNDVDVIEGSIPDPDTASKAVDGMDAVIHTGQPPWELPGDPLEHDQRLLDLATRGTHVLLKAAVEAGVRRIVYAGTLRIFSSYPDDVFISEYWEPHPSSDMAEMAPYLAEKVCTEFARAHPVTVTVLRLGKLVLEEEVDQGNADLMWLDYRDAARALGWALDRDASSDVWWTRRFALYHICAAIPNAKFLTARAATKGFTPEHNFEACWASRTTGGTP